MLQSFVLLIFLSFAATSQTINTVAGSGPPGGTVAPDGGAAVNLQIGAPSGVAVDPAGNVYFVSPVFHRVLKMDSHGVVTTVAGNGTTSSSGDGGPAASAGLSPDRVAIDKSGNLFIADSTNCFVREVSGGIITTVAGNGPYASLGDGGPALAARVCPLAIAVDGAGNLYLAEANRLRKISSGFITTVANTTSAYPAPPGVAVDAAGNVFFTNGESVMEFSGGTTSTVAGSNVRGITPDGATAAGALLAEPSGLAVDGSGNLYIAESSDHRVRKVSGGILTTVAGNGASTYSGDGGPAINAGLSPIDVAIDAAGNLYIADSGNSRIRLVANSLISTVAGGSVNYSGDGGPATAALLNNPLGVAVDAGNTYYIADTGNHRVRKVSGGVITTVAGNGSPGFSGDGATATAAQLNSPARVAVDSSGNLYIADTANHRIRKVAGGLITTVAGNGTPGFSGDGGQAVSAALHSPSGLVFDSAGNLFIADSANNRVREVTGGIITTVASSLSNPSDVLVDPVGNLYVADTGHNTISKVSSGVVTTIGSATGPAGLAWAGGVRLDYSVPSYVVSAPTVGLGPVAILAGRPDICSPLGGVAASRGPSPLDATCPGGLFIPGDGFSGDGGPAFGSQLERPAGLAIDSGGALYIADSGNNRIRRVCNIPVVVDTNPTGLSITIDGVTYTAPQTISFCAAEDHSIGIPSQPTGDTFTTWNDGGAATHNIKVQSAATYVATFNNLHYYLSLPNSGVSAAGGSISATSTPAGVQDTSPFRWATYYPSGASVQLTAVAKPGYVFRDWGGDFISASANPLTITMTRNYTVWANFQPSPGAAPSIGQLQLPFSGSGATAKLTFDFSHPSGYQSLDVVNVLINNALDGRQACYLAYIVSSRTLALVDDAGDAGGPFAGTVALGDLSVIRNSQCAVSLASATNNGPDLFLTLNITFQPSFGGGKLFYMAARDVAQKNTGWQVMGAWQAPFTPPGPIAVSGLTPASATSILGERQTFTLTFTDAQGAADIGIVNLLVNNALDGRQACYLAYDQSSNSLFLVDDAGDAGGPYAGGIVLNGGGGSVRNGQCAASGSAVRNGNTLALVLNLRFNVAQFNGTRALYLAARNGATNTGWQAMGVWSFQ